MTSTVFHIETSSLGSHPNCVFSAMPWTTFNFHLNFVNFPSIPRFVVFAFESTFSRSHTVSSEEVTFSSKRAWRAFWKKRSFFIALSLRSAARQARVVEIGFDTAENSLALECFRDGSNNWRIIRFDIIWVRWWEIWVRKWNKVWSSTPGWLS